MASTSGLAAEVLIRWMCLTKRFGLGKSQSPRLSRTGAGSRSLSVQLEEGADGCGAKVFADHLGRTDELSERKLAELYEQLGRLTVERDFLLRSSAL